MTSEWVDRGGVQPMCVASTFSGSQPGGLTTVIERLIDSTASEMSWTWVARLDQAEGGATDYWRVCSERRRRTPSAEVRVVAPSAAYRPALRFVNQILGRPGGERLAPAVYGAAMRRSVARQFPSQPRHVHWVGTGIELLGYEMLRCARAASIPFTVWPALHVGAWGDAAIDGRLYRSADSVLVQSRHESARLQAMGVRPGRIFPVPLGPSVVGGGDGARFRVANAVPPRVPLITYMARQSKHKGLLAVIAAARALRAAGHTFHLAVAGPPGDVRGVVSGPGLIQLGLCDEATKADLLAATDVFCVPSEAESFGIVYVDAWSAGVPVVSGLAAPVVERTIDGVDGFCVAQDVGSIVAVLARLLEDAELRRRVGLAGQRKQRGAFSWEAFREQHLVAFAAAARLARVPSPRS